MARPLKIIDEEAVLKLARIGCTFSEIADWFNCDKETIRKRFGDVVRDGHAEVKMSLRRAQLRSALENNNVTMQIWLGKQMLGQRDDFDSGDRSELVSGVKFDLVKKADEKDTAEREVSSTGNVQSE